MIIAFGSGHRSRKKRAAADLEVERIAVVEDRAKASTIRQSQSKAAGAQFRAPAQAFWNSLKISPRLRTGMPTPCIDADLPADAGWRRPRPARDPRGVY